MDNELEWLDKLLDNAKRKLAEWEAAEAIRQRKAALAFWPKEYHKWMPKFTTSETQSEST